jgi:putative addiction module component (TIGR02574 family)
MNDSHPGEGVFMSVSIEELGIDKLSVSDRLELLEQIWDSLPEQVSPNEIPAWHLAILEKRLADADANPEAGIPWETVLERLTSKQ